MDPRDPAIVLSFADCVSDVTARRILLRNYLALAIDGDRTQRQDVLARLELAERLGDRQTAKLASSYKHYRFALNGFFPDGQTQRGVLLKVRLDGEGPLRLLVDSGAEGITVSASRVRGAHLQTLASARLDGLGMDGGMPARVALADTVAIDDLHLENCLIRVADRELVPGADGVIGLNLFQDFLLRLDLPGRTLDLLPISEPVRGPGVFLPAAPIYRLSHLVLLRATLDGTSGYFVLDTGSSFSAVARRGGRRAAAQSCASLRGAAGELLAAFRLPPLDLAFAGTRLTDDHPIALDLQQLSQAAGADIGGLAGFPLLRKSVFLLDYRSGLIRFAR